MTRYIKTIVAILGGVSSWGITAAADEAITQVELYGLLGVLATALGVYAFPNTPPAGEPADPEISERGPGRDARGRFVRNEGGHADVSLITCIACVWVAVILTFWAFESGPFS